MDKETMLKFINAANRIADGIDTHNKIMSSFLLQATSESLFKKMTDNKVNNCFIAISALYNSIANCN